MVRHSFHIPVMGAGFTIDSAIRVSHLGIDSVLALNATTLQEKLRKKFCHEYGLPYIEIADTVEDCHAKRITEYLNVIHQLCLKNFNKVRSFAHIQKEETLRCIGLLPNGEDLKREFLEVQATGNEQKCQDWIDENLSMGSIDVNIMTKLDRENYYKGEKLSFEHNEGHIGVRGFANSTLESSLVLSAGFNPRLFNYITEFKDFYPDKTGKFKKRITLKVSDFRSALIQGKYLAKKGIWVSEYRIESGLNCGGHAFATEGYLLGPILDEFKNEKDKLYNEVGTIFKAALEEKGYHFPNGKLPFRCTAQGGVGTSEEHNFLLKEYNLDSIGWGSPFLLVPEVTNVDESTLERLKNAKEEDFCLSEISPLGVPFNILKGTSKEVERDERIKNEKPGSPCFEEKLALFNTEFTERPVCVASRTYQKRKIEELKSKNIEKEIYDKEYHRIVEKTCLCTGLVNSALIVNELDPYTKNSGVTICPGPNMYYFRKVMTLQEMVDHIYGRVPYKFHVPRPHMFIKELSLYVDLFASNIEACLHDFKPKEMDRLRIFASNLSNGIGYYRTLFRERNTFTKERKPLLEQLGSFEKRITSLVSQLSPV